VVQALAPDRSDQPFGKAILPWRGWCNWLISDGHGAKSARDNGAVDPIDLNGEESTANQISVIIAPI
jgi:hypothetical protein